MEFQLRLYGCKELGMNSVNLIVRTCSSSTGVAYFTSSGRRRISLEKKTKGVTDAVHVGHFSAIHNLKGIH